MMARNKEKHGEGQTRVLGHVASEEDYGREDFQSNLSSIVEE
jgi:hypothetical protein